MTWTQALAPTATGMLNDSAAASPSITPNAVGDMLFLAIGNGLNNTSSVSAVSSSNATWALLRSVAFTNHTYTLSIFLGTVTAASAGTLTYTWTSGAPASQLQSLCAQFHSTVGSWSVDVTGTVDISTTNSAWATLTPAGTAELYVGYCLNPTAASAGTTSGYTYLVTANNSNGYAWNPSVSAASAPVWADTTEDAGIMALIAETTSGGAAVPPSQSVVMRTEPVSRASGRLIRQ